MSPQSASNHACKYEFEIHTSGEDTNHGEELIQQEGGNSSSDAVWLPIPYVSEQSEGTV